MGYEDRDYYRDQYQGFGGLSFDKKSIVFTLIIINVVFFFLDLFTPQVYDNAGLAEENKDFTQWLSYALAIKTDQLWQVWTFLTHGFVHASYGTKLGIFHILGNMFTLFFLGRPVEERLGRSGFLWFYLTSIVVGGLVWLIWHLAMPGEASTFIVGASGAVSAVVAYFIFMAPNTKLMVFGVVPVAAWGVGVFFLIMNMLHAFNPNSHVAWQAHLGGAAFGYLAFNRGWTFGRFEGVDKTLGSMFGSGPKLRVHDPDAADEKLKSQADAILAKISEKGESSLSGKERRILKKYSSRLRKNRDD